MKHIVQLLILCLFCQSMIGQINVNTEISTDRSQSPESSEALNLLYEQARELENNGTPLEIEENRLAIKMEWASISPEIAEVYKPITVNFSAEEQAMFAPQRNLDRPNSVPTNRSWGEDLLVHEGLMSGVDMEVGASGDIYLLGYYNELNIAEGSNIFIYKSTDNGVSFSIWDEISIPGVSYDKMQLVLLDPDQYLTVYAVTSTEVFGVYRWNIDTQDLDFQIISAGVSDFSVDRNFPANTNNVRVFATYLKPNGGGCPNRVHSARSTAGSFGFDWVDETLVSTICSTDLDFAYGLSGATYTAFVSTITGNTYAQNNPNYNDPASWSDEQTVSLGENIEIRGLTIRATRKPFASDEVLLFTSYRTEGTTEDFGLLVFRRQDASDFVAFDLIGDPDNDTSILYKDGWIRREIGAEVIQLSYLLTFGSSGSSLRTSVYDGNSIGDGQIISDVSEVFAGTAIAENQDNNPCVAFGLNTVIDGENIYFDTDTVLGINENSISNFEYFPNPTSEVVTIKASQTIDKAELYTITGKKVKEFTPNLTEVDLNVQDLSEGIYIATIHSNNQTANFKLLKN